MKSSKRTVLGAMLFGAISIAAGRQLAMRVEVAPVEAGETGILTEISCFVAPEDRGALGSDAMLWVELTRAEERVLRRGWALKVDDPAAPLSVTAELPEGEHHLRVDVIGAGDRARGVWFGDVSISAPSSESDSVSKLSPSPLADPNLAPDPDSATDSTPRPVPDEPAPDPESAASSEPAFASESEPSVSAAAKGAESAAAVGPVDQRRQASPADTEPDFGELTVSVVRHGLPVIELDAVDLEVVAGRTPVPVMSISGPGDAPLVLGIAVDLGSDSARDQSWIGRMIGSLADRDRARTRVVHRAGFDSGWDTVPSAVADLIAAMEPGDRGDLGELVAETLDAFTGRWGRCWLLLITDGRRSPDGGWRDVRQQAAAAGVPILVAGLWHDEFGAGIRRNLGRLAEASGGAAFYIQGPSQIDDLVDRFGAILDGSSSVRVAVPAGTDGVDVRFTAGEADVFASTGVRAVPVVATSSDAGRRGRFTTFADAAIFADCASGRRWPVAMEADYLSAERAYLESRSEPGAPLMMSLEGRVEPRPPMEGDGPVDTLIIDRFIAVHPGEACE